MSGATPRHMDGRPIVPRVYYWHQTFPRRPWRGYVGTDVVYVSYGLCPGQHRTEKAALRCARRLSRDRQRFPARPDA